MKQWFFSHFFQVFLSALKHLNVPDTNLWNSSIDLKLGILIQSNSNAEFTQLYSVVESSWCMPEKQLYEYLQGSLACFI